LLLESFFSWITPQYKQGIIIQELHYLKKSWRLKNIL